MLLLTFLNPSRSQIVDLGFVTTLKIDVAELVSDDVLGLRAVVVAVRMEHR